MAVVPSSYDNCLVHVCSHKRSRVAAAADNIDNDNSPACGRHPIVLRKRLGALGPSDLSHRSVPISIQPNLSLVTRRPDSPSEFQRVALPIARASLSARIACPRCCLYAADPKQPQLRPSHSTVPGVGPCVAGGSWLLGFSSALQNPALSSLGYRYLSRVSKCTLSIPRLAGGKCPGYVPDCVVPVPPCLLSRRRFGGLLPCDWGSQNSTCCPW